MDDSVADPERLCEGVYDYIGEYEPKKQVELKEETGAYGHRWPFIPRWQKGARSRKAGFGEMFDGPKHASVSGRGTRDLPLSLSLSHSLSLSPSLSLIRSLSLSLPRSLSSFL